MTARQRAAAYRKGDLVFLYSEDRTTAGFWQAKGPVHVVEASNAERLEVTIREVLALSRQGVPDMPGEKFEELLAAAKVKSHRAFEKDAKLVNVSCSGGRVAFSSTKNIAPGRGFTQNDIVEEIDLGSLGIGAALLRAFERCE